MVIIVVFLARLNEPAPEDETRDRCQTVAVTDYNIMDDCSLNLNESITDNKINKIHS